MFARQRLPKNQCPFSAQRTLCFEPCLVHCIVRRQRKELKAKGKLRVGLNFTIPASLRLVRADFRIFMSNNLVEIKRVWSGETNTVAQDSALSERWEEMFLRRGRANCLCPIIILLELYFCTGTTVVYATTENVTAAVYNFTTWSHELNATSAPTTNATGFVSENSNSTSNANMTEIFANSSAANFSENLNSSTSDYFNASDSTGDACLDNSTRNDSMATGSYENICNSTLTVNTTSNNSINATEIRSVSNFSFMGVSTFPAGSVPVDIEILHLEGNDIHEIKQSDFFNLSSLIELYLQENAISEINGSIFANNGLLKVIDLSSNKISGLPKFVGLESIEEMYFSSNQIERLKTETFSETSTLKVLWLDENLLVEIEHDAFKGLTSLKDLNLNDNDLSVISWDLEDLGALHELHLERNKLTEYPQYNGSNNVLRKLFLSGNQISEIRNDSYDSFTRLETLDLSRNQLTDFPIEIIESIKVKKLNFSAFFFFKKKINETNCSDWSTAVSFETIKKRALFVLFVLLTNGKLKLKQICHSTPHKKIFLSPTHAPRFVFKIGQRENSLGKESCVAHHCDVRKLHESAFWSLILQIPSKTEFYLSYSSNRLTTLTNLPAVKSWPSGKAFVSFAWNPFHCGIDVCWFKLGFVFCSISQQIFLASFRRHYEVKKAELARDQTKPSLCPKCSLVAQELLRSYTGVPTQAIKSSTV